MVIKSALVIFYFLIGLNSIKAQITSVNTTKIPQESVFIHYNDSFLLTGEYLFYSLYCINIDTGRLSTLSKIAYVELVSPSGKPIFRHKITLTHGQGSGEFFIPTEVPSNSYKLLGYTSLMKNGQPEIIFEADLAILNPYTNNHLKSEGDAEKLNNIVLTKSVSKTSADDSNELAVKNNLLNKKAYGPREKLLISNEEIRNIIENGSYSISVRKLDSIADFGLSTSINFKSKINDYPSFVRTNEIYWLPEIRGEIISGRIESFDKNVNLNGLKVAFSIPGHNYVFQIANTGIDGTFHFVLGNSYSGKSAQIHVLNYEKEFEILLDKHRPIKVSDNAFRKVYLNERMKDVILERSIHNQIENNYFNLRPDSILDVPKKLPFYGNNAKEYVLDEYTRFPTIKATIIEILEDVSVKYLNTGPILNIKSDDLYSEQLGFLPLILLDGNYVKDITELLDFDARRVESIKIVTGQYILGPQIFQGVMDISTIDGNFEQYYPSKSSLRFDLFTPLLKKYYFKQEYESQKSDFKLPDYRHQLYWNVHNNSMEKEKQISFYTSDVLGRFEIAIEGFMQDGKPISLRDIFIVE